MPRGIHFTVLHVNIQDPHVLCQKNKLYSVFSASNDGEEGVRAEVEAAMICWLKEGHFQHCRAFVRHWGLTPSWWHHSDWCDKPGLVMGVVALRSGCHFLLGNLPRGQASSTTPTGLYWCQGSASPSMSASTTVTQLQEELSLHFAIVAIPAFMYCAFGLLRSCVMTALCFVSFFIILFYFIFLR